MASRSRTVSADARSIGLVDDEHVGDLHEPGLVRLHGVAPARGSPPRRWCRRRRRSRPRPARRRPSRSATHGDPTASRTRTAAGVATDRPPRWPRVAIDRMYTPSSSVWSPMRTRSPRMAPPLNGDDGSIASTATGRRSGRISLHTALVSVDFPAPGAPVMPDGVGVPAARVDDRGHRSSRLRRPAPRSTAGAPERSAPIGRREHCGLGQRRAVGRCIRAGGRSGHSETAVPLVDPRPAARPR